MKANQYLKIDPKSECYGRHVNYLLKINYEVTYTTKKKTVVPIYYVIKRYCCRVPRD